MPVSCLCIEKLIDRKTGRAVQIIAGKGKAVPSSYAIGVAIVKDPFHDCSLAPCFSVDDEQVVEVGKQLLMTRGALTTFSIANDVAKYFAIIPAMLMATFPAIAPLNVMQLHSPTSAILSAVIFNALIIVALIPLALKGVRYRALGAAAVLRRHRFAARREVVDGVTYLYGDRNRWTKLATLVSHLGLILFLMILLLPLALMHGQPSRPEVYKILGISVEGQRARGTCGGHQEGAWRRAVCQFLNGRKIGVDVQGQHRSRPS